MNDSRIMEYALIKKRFWIVFIFFTIILSTSFAREFVHVFTSKGVYETYEDLWFKCLVLNNRTFEVSNNSQTAYLEIVDFEDSVVWTGKYHVVNGECDGHVLVGENWKAGEYRMFAYTRNSFGQNDSVVFPKRLLIVKDLSEVPGYLKSVAKMKSYVYTEDSVPLGLKVKVEFDSTEYHTRSKVKATVRVSDSWDNPVQALVSISIFDAFYKYTPSEENLVSQCLGARGMIMPDDCAGNALFLSDGAVSGHLKSGKRNSSISMSGQLINVFDLSCKKGVFNILETIDDGYFEVSPESAASLGTELFLKPVSGEDANPYILFDSPFKEIASVRKKAKEINFPIVRSNRNSCETSDSFRLSNRRVIFLDEVVVKAKMREYPKRTKLMGYLDSLSLSKEVGWVCGCLNPSGGTFLNDYKEGYTHHPHGVTYEPKYRLPPKKGEKYELIKYEWTGTHYYVKDIQYLTYNGSRYSEEELLRMNGIWKTQGYQTKYRFQNPTEEEMLSSLYDNRNTLLWIPRAQTNEDGILYLEFYTSDICSVFNVSGFVLSHKHGKGCITDTSIVVK